jgi:hypothetical protein
MNQLVPVNAAPAFNMSDIERVASAIANGGLFGSRDPNAVLTLCLLAHAEGQHPAVVFRDYHIIQGKPAKKADAMLRDFINAGGKVEWHQLDDTKADATFTHPSGSARIDWTLERAKKAQLTTAMWTKYPRQMLRSRVISEGVRTVYPGATSGLYEENEVRDIVAETSTNPVLEAQDGGIIEGQFEERQVSPDGPATLTNDPQDDQGRAEHLPPHTTEPNRQTGVKLDGKWTSITGLEKAIKAFASDMDKCATWEDWVGLRNEAKYVGLEEQAARDHPDWWNGWAGMPERFVPLSRKIEILEANLAEDKAAIMSAG